jgi:hypothetical protein
MVASPLTLFPQGGALAIWHEQVTQSGFTSNSIMGDFFADGRWNQPFVIAGGGSSYPEALDAVIDLRGNVLVAWVENGHPATVRAVRFDGFASGPVRMLGSATDSPWQLRLATSRGDPTTPGDAMAIWTGQPSMQPSILVSRYASATDTWDPSPTRLNSAISAAQSPALAMDAAGNAVANWIQQNEAGAPALYHDCFNRMTQQWSGSDYLNVTIGAMSSATVFDAAGNAYVVLAQDITRPSGPAESRVVGLSYNRAEQRWEPRGDYDVGTTPGVSFYPRLAASVYSGATFGIWFHTPDSSLLARGAVYGNPLGWATAASTIRMDDSADPANPSGQVLFSGGVGLLGIAMAPDGEAVAVWNQADGIYVRNTTRTGVWGNRQKIAANSNNPHTAIVMDEASRATLAWLDADGTLWATTYR